MSVKIHNLNKSHTMGSYLGPVTLSLTLLCSNVFAQDIVATADDVKPEQVFQVSQSQDAGSGGGGPWVAESEIKWKRGEITAIEVCFGNYVEKMTVFYGGERGTVFGNPNAGVGCEMWNASGGGYLKSIYVWAGTYMDSIQFHMSVGEPSKRFGGGGGGRKILEDPNGGAIRTIDARSGRYLDRVKANFGLPYYIDNIKPDYEALKKQMDATKPERIDLQTIDACDSSTPVTQKIIVEKTLTESHSFKFSNTTSISLTTSIEGGFGPFVKVSASTSIGTSFTVEKAKNITTSSTYRREIDGVAKAGEKVHIITISKQAKLDLPFTYDLIHYRNGNKGDIVKKQNFNGVYKGNKTAATDTKKIDYSCETNQPLNPSRPVNDEPTNSPSVPINAQPVNTSEPRNDEPLDDSEFSDDGSMDDSEFSDDGSMDDSEFSEEEFETWESEEVIETWEFEEVIEEEDF